MHDGPVGNGGPLPDRDGRAGFRVDDHAVLDVGVGADHRGLNVAIGRHFIGPDHGVGADKHVFLDDDQAAQNGRRVDKGTGMNPGQVAAGVFTDHEGSPLNTLPVVARRCPQPGTRLPR